MEVQGARRGLPRGAQAALACLHEDVLQEDLPVVALAGVRLFESSPGVVEASQELLRPRPLDADGHLHPRGRVGPRLREKLAAGLHGAVPELGPRRQQPDLPTQVLGAAQGGEANAPAALGEAAAAAEGRRNLEVDLPVELLADVLEGDGGVLLHRPGAVGPLRLAEEDEPQRPVLQARADAMLGDAHGALPLAENALYPASLGVQRALVRDPLHEAPQERPHCLPVARPDLAMRRLQEHLAGPLGSLPSHGAGHAAERSLVAEPLEHPRHLEAELLVGWTALQALLEQRPALPELP
mmetsp:Transcript_17371/g.55596  ORF Transcript_17371/g.55596 Transcript_17371/m.55596 type:complete len:297 (+) Transcript_17371:1049-1939(+)